MLKKKSKYNLKGIQRTIPPILVFHLNHVAEFTEQGWQRAGVVVLQPQPVAERLAIFGEQLADGEAGAFLSTEQLDQLGRQSLDALHLCEGQHFLLATLQHLKQARNENSIK